jgi:hypothetical protein
VKLSGGEETYTATVTFDTKDLYGKIESTYKIKLKKP